MRTVLITLIGPERTSDLVVDADTPVAELLPSLLAAGGVAGDAAGDDPEGATWTVALTGKQPVAPDQTLDEAGVLDGAVLVLRRETPAGGGPALAPAPTRGPAGSPLERTRALVDGQLATEPRRARLRAATDATAAAEGRQSSLEHAVGTAPVAGRCATIAVVSPKGGVGKTTIAILLGELLCSLRADHVLALDADSDYGSLGRVAPARAGAAAADGRDAAIFDALAEGSVTFAELDRTLWALPGGLRVIPSPRDPAAMARATRSVYARVLGSLQRLSDVLIVDCGTGLGQPGVQAAILACDQLVLVTDATGATASLAVEAGALLERTGRPITVVANRLHRGRQGSDELRRMDALFPHANALVGVPHEDELELALRGELRLAELSSQAHSAVLELAAALSAGWALNPTAAAR